MHLYQILFDTTVMNWPTANNTMAHYNGNPDFDIPEPNFGYFVFDNLNEHNFRNTFLTRLLSDISMKDLIFNFVEFGGDDELVDILKSSPNYPTLVVRIGRELVYEDSILTPQLNNINDNDQVIRQLKLWIAETVASRPEIPEDLVYITEIHPDDAIAAFGSNPVGPDLVAMMFPDVQVPNIPIPNVPNFEMPVLDMASLSPSSSVSSNFSLNPADD